MSVTLIVKSVVSLFVLATLGSAQDSSPSFITEAPAFVTEFDQDLTIAIGEEYILKLPDTIDPDESASGINTYLTQTEGQEDHFPSFLTFDNSTNTLVFRPDDSAQQIGTFFFDVVLEEANFPSVKNVYAMSVTIIENSPINFTYSLDTATNGNRTYLVYSGECTYSFDPESTFESINFYFALLWTPADQPNGWDEKNTISFNVTIDNNYQVSEKNNALRQEWIIRKVDADTAKKGQIRLSFQIAQYPEVYQRMINNQSELLILYQTDVQVETKYEDSEESDLVYTNYGSDQKLEMLLPSKSQGAFGVTFTSALALLTLLSQLLI